MSWLKKILIICAILTVLFLVTQRPWPLSESLHQWLVNHQSVPADQVPLTASGHVDFIQLANNRFNKDVTVENNIIVDLYQILPTSEEDGASITDEYIALLGNPEKDVSSSYTSSAEMLQRIEADSESDSESENVVAASLHDQYNQCLSRPWRSDEFPEFQQWIESNKNALDKMVAASTKPYYYHPLVVTNEETTPMIGVLLHHAQQMREIARTLNMRALNHLAEDRVDPCLSDLAATRRLGFKIRHRGSTLVEQLIGIAIVGMVFECESQVLSSGKLTAKQCVEYQKVIAETTTRGTLVACLENGERLMMMDAIQWMADGNDALRGVISGNQNGLNIASMFRSFVDWKETAVVCDDFYQKLIETSKIENDVQRQLALKKLDEELADSERSRSPFSMAIRYVSGARGRGQVVGETMILLLAPAILQVDMANIRSKMHEISALGFEIEKFRITGGALPESLSQLPAEITAPLLIDRFTGKNINYHITNNGYRLYSVGRNGLDDQVDPNGQLIEFDEDQTTDDVVVKVELLDNSPGR